MQQTFLFKHTSPNDVCEWLRDFESIATIDERTGFFVFKNLPGQAAFTFDCELIDGGVKSKRTGEYFAFLGMFVEGLTGQFGSVVIENC